MGQREDNSEVQAFVEDVAKGLGYSCGRIRLFVNKFHTYDTLASMRKITNEQWITFELPPDLLTAIRKQLSVTASATRIPAPQDTHSACGGRSAQPQRRSSNSQRAQNRHTLLSEWTNRHFTIVSCDVVIALTKLSTFHHFVADHNDLRKVSTDGDSALATAIGEMDLFAQANWAILLEHLSEDQVERVLDEGVRSAAGKVRFSLAPQSALGKRLRAELYGHSPHPVRQETENRSAFNMAAQFSQSPGERRKQAEGQNSGKEEGRPRKSEETTPNLIERKHSKVSAVPSTAPTADTGELSAQLARAEQRAFTLENENVELRSTTAMWEQRARVAEKKLVDIFNDPNAIHNLKIEQKKKLLALLVKESALKRGTDSADTSRVQPSPASPPQHTGTSLAANTSTSLRCAERIQTTTLADTKASSLDETTSTSSEEAMTSHEVSRTLGRTSMTPVRTQTNSWSTGTPARTHTELSDASRAWWSERASTLQPRASWNGEAWRRIWQRNTTSSLSNAWDLKTSLQRGELVWALREYPPTGWDIDVVHLNDKILTFDMATEIFTLLNQAKSLRSIRIYNNLMRGDVDKLFNILAPSHVDYMEEMHLTNNGFTTESVIRFLKRFENSGKRSKKTKLVRFDFRDWRPSVKEYASTGALKICHGIECRDKYRRCKYNADIHIPKYEKFG